MFQDRVYVADSEYVVSHALDGSSMQRHLAGYVESLTVDSRGIHMLRVVTRQQVQVLFMRHGTLEPTT